MLVPDFKKHDGLWAMKTLGPRGAKTIRTVSGMKWLAMQARCKEGGTYQAANPQYVGCKNAFKDFQEFAEWHTDHPDYDKGYELDKDLLVAGNKTYSPTTCTLLPSQLNTLFRQRHKRSVDLPNGVTRRGNKYVVDFAFSSESLSTERVYSGRLETPDAAFNFYKQLKESVVLRLADEYKGSICIDTYEALLRFKVTPY